MTAPLLRPHTDPAGPSTVRAPWPLPPWIPLGLGLSLLAALAAHAFLGTFARYAADDYCTASILRTEGLFGAQAYWYRIWSGRFSFTFAVSLVELLGTAVVPVLPTLALLAWLGTTWWAIRQALRALGWSLSGLWAPVLAGLFVYAVLDGTPDPGQSLYWQTGMVTYLAPLILLTAYLGWLARRGRMESAVKPGPAALAPGFAVPFLAGGSSETYAAFQVAGLGLGIGLLLLWPDAAVRRRIVPLLAVGLAGAFLALVIVAAAPGNSVRQVDNPAPNLAYALPSAVRFTVVFAAKAALRSPAGLLLALLVPAALAATQPVRSSTTTGAVLHWRWLVLAAAAAFAWLVSAFAPSFYALAFQPPDRALIIPQVALVLAVAATGILLGRAVQDGLRQSLTPTARWLAAGLVAVLILAGPVLSTVELAGQAPAAAAYAARWDAIDAQIRAERAAGQRTVQVPPLPAGGAIPNMDYVGPDASDWFNVCVARLYDLDAIASTPNGR